MNLLPERCPLAFLRKLQGEYKEFEISHDDEEDEDELNLYFSFKSETKKQKAGVNPFDLV
ncbi:hypothetical protein OS493_040459, partial [Desmophyllum pertusum]